MALDLSVSHHAPAVARRMADAANRFLAALDPARLTHAGRVDALVAIERQLAWLAGLQQLMLATIAADDAAKSGDAAQSDDRWVREGRNLQARRNRAALPRDGRRLRTLVRAVGDRAGAA